LSEQGLHWHGKRLGFIFSMKLHGHVDIRQIVFVREIDGSLGVREIASFAVVFGPGIDVLHVLERAPVLQQYFHNSFKLKYRTGNLVASSIRAHEKNAINSRSVSIRRDGMTPRVLSTAVTGQV
jgi:hypothetical protein